MRVKGNPIMFPNMEVEGELFVDCIKDENGEIIPTDNYFICVDTANDKSRHCIQYYRVSKEGVVEC